MFFAPEHKVAFFRIPRTGSTTATHLLNTALGHMKECGDGHGTYADAARRKDFPDFTGWRTISFVRDPLRWLDSVCSLARKPNRWSLRIIGGAVTRFCGDDRKVDTAALLDALKMTPYDWTLDPDGAPAPGLEIWRTEDMDDFAASFGLPPVHHNTTLAANRFILNWTEDDHEVIRQKFHRELAHYPEGL
jgi:hypothetical protein